MSLITQVHVLMSVGRIWNSEVALSKPEGVACSRPDVPCMCKDVESPNPHVEGLPQAMNCTSSRIYLFPDMW
jgi:hypothetical protein